MRLAYTAAVLALLFAAMGIAYSLWQEELLIQTTVKTGEVMVAFVNESLRVSDEGADPQAEGYNNEEELDVASAELKVNATDGRGNSTKLSFIISNAYPGYSVCAYFNVSNVGTIPVDLTKSEFSGVNETALSVSLKPTAEDDVLIKPGGSQEFELCVTVLNADEVRTYEFSLTLEFTQWNGQ